MSLSSWFNNAVAHPAMAALASLANHDAIKDNPAALAAISEAQKTATVVASTLSTGAHQIAADVAASANPIVSNFESALQIGLDAALTEAFPAGAAITVPVANALLSLLEHRVHSVTAAYFSTAKAQVPSLAAPVANGG